MAQALTESTDHPIVHAFAGLTEALHAVRNGDLTRAHAPLEAALDSFASHGEVYGQIFALLGLGWTHALQENNAAALSYHEKALALFAVAGAKHRGVDNVAMCVFS